MGFVGKKQLVYKRILLGIEIVNLMEASDSFPRCVDLLVI